MKKKFFSIIIAAFLLLSLLSFVGCKKAVERSRYEITAEYQDGILEVLTDFTYVNNTGTEISELKFNLYGNAYREDSAYAPVSALFSPSAYYEGKSYGSLEILSVSGCSEWEIGGADENILIVETKKSVYPGESTSISIESKLTLAKVNHRTGITRHSVNLGNFYPVLCAWEKPVGFYECEYYSDGDPFYSECADYSVTFTVPSQFKVAMSGEIISESKEGEKTTYHSELKNARDFAVVLSEEFQILQKESNGVTIKYYYYKDTGPERMLELLEKCMKYFSDTFGEYAYPVYSVVQTGFSVGGMEYPGLSMLGDHLIGGDYQYTAVHETAHQWWYAAVGNNQLENAWMDEGLAEYSTLMFFEKNPEYGFTRQALMLASNNAYQALYNVQSQIFGQADTAMNKKLGEYLSEYHYIVIAYDKGKILFDTLRDALKDKKFVAALKRYYRDCSGKIAKPEDLMYAFRKSGTNLNSLFTSFIDGTAVI